MPRDNSREVRQDQIAKLVAKGSSGMKILAQSMTQPLRQFQDYSSVGRRAVLVESLKQGQDPTIDTDVVGGIAYVVSDLGADISRIVNPETVRVHTQSIAANPQISYEQLAARKYDVQTRVGNYSQSEIFRVEDRLIFQGLLAVSTHEYETAIFQTDSNHANPIHIGKKKRITIPGTPENTPVVSTFAQVGLKEISSAMAQIQKHGGLQPTSIFMNGLNVQILRNMNNNGANGYFVDFDTSKEIMRTGMIGTVFGLNIYVSPEVPANRIIVTAEPEFTGRIVERIPLTVIPYEDPAKRMTGFSIFEEVGIYFHNPKAVATIKLT